MASQYMIQSIYDNVERFSLGGAAHEPRRGATQVGGRAGERKTLYIHVNWKIRKEPNSPDGVSPTLEEILRAAKIRH